MLIDGYKPDRARKTRTYPVPTPSRRGFRWKAVALRGIHLWTRSSAAEPATIVVPALYNCMPAENLALGWFNEIDALVAIRQRMICAAKITGWDVFTFHTLHNADHFFDTAIAAVRDTWMKEGNLSSASHIETRRRFGKPYDYHRIHARLIENLVFQSSLLEWLSHRAGETPLQFHVVGTALLSALVSSGSVSFSAGVHSALKFGMRWDEAVQKMASSAKSEDDAGWFGFNQVCGLMEGQSSLSLGVVRNDLPKAQTPANPFWFSPTAKDQPRQIATAEEAAAALETMNLSSWGYSSRTAGDDMVRGWLISPLHPMARLCRWSLSNYLLATPKSAMLFLDHIAPIAGSSGVRLLSTPAQNRLRLSRMKVTGP
jgi:hypothetical protein